MPVSSPSYFPPAGGGGQIVGTTAGNGATGVRTFLAGQSAGNFTQPVNDLIVVGDHAFAAGTVGAPITDANWAGSIIVGSQAATAAVNASGLSGGVPGPSTIVGFNAYKATTGLTDEAAFGANILTTWGGNLGNFPTDNVLVGNSIGGKLVTPTSGSGNGYASNVVVGNGAASANLAGQSKTVQLNVVIGFHACIGMVGNPGTGGPGVSQNVVIGANAGNLMGNADGVTGTTNNVFIGYQCGDTQFTRSNVFVGSGTSSGAGGGSTNNLALGGILTGGTNHTTGTDRNVTIGCGVAIPGTVSRCIVIGAGAGPIGNAVQNLNDQFLVETFDGATRRNLLYGLLGAVSPGGLIVGFSTPGVNRDVPGFNVLKLLDGSVTGVAPIGGGMFYSSGGRLHWVDTANNDWVLTGTAAGQLASTTVGYTNNAGAAAATLTNAPTAGNPTKWVPVNDNGTIRNLPLW